MSERSIVILTTFIDIIDHTGSLEDDIDDPGDGLVKPKRYQNGSPNTNIVLPDNINYPDTPYEWLPFRTKAQAKQPPATT